MCVCVCGWVCVCVCGFPRSSVGKESTRNVEDPGSIPGSGKFPGEGNDNPLQCSCLENPMDREAWKTTVHGIARVCVFFNCHKMFFPKQSLPQNIVLWTVYRGTPCCINLIKVSEIELREIIRTIGYLFRV